MMKYLYGLSIQGIQDYIFETNKLKEIVGASELVASLPKTIVENTGGFSISDADENLLIDAAGNFKYVFDDKSICQAVFKNLPKEIYRLGGDITVSQAVILLNNDQISREKIDELETKLKAERNRQVAKSALGIMSPTRVGKTGNIEVVKNQDRNQVLKTKAVDQGENNLLHILVDNPKDYSFTNNLEEITNDQFGNWVAIVHADGNGLGKKIIRMAKSIQDVKGGFRELSLRLDQATKAAVRTAFDKIIPTDEKVIPFRPIIVGGDDVSIVVRGDLALRFTEQFLVDFEKETQEIFADFDVKFSLNDIFKGGLTACAGIAYIKSHYPFHYGIGLAEALTKQAKKASKDLPYSRPPSSLMFHKLHSSFVRKWEEIEANELTAGVVSFANGPYFIDEKQGLSVKKLSYWAEQMQRPTAPKSNIRQWFTLLDENPSRAKELAERTRQITGGDLWNKLNLKTMLDVDATKKTHLFDVLTIAEIQTNKNN
ncbi:MAG: hypothetical protein NXI23_25310 [Bacteroidetes bacterium]|nr:hypothetical protein [Bacteroidota bacterium]